MPSNPSSRTLITTADDFGLSLNVNAAVQEAATNGILTSASLMVAAPEAADAVRRAYALGGRLRVGLHLVVIEGPAMLPYDVIPNLVDQHNAFPNDQVGLGFRYAFNRPARRQLAAEIRAQFQAFRATGLTLDHANAHKHMHLHPVVGHLMLSIGREFGLRAIRVPAEPPGPGAGLGARALHRWTRLLRWQAHRAGMLTNDTIFGLRDSGRMTPARVQALLDNLPPGLSELYVHPATGPDAMLRRHMPTYDHAAELAALLTARMPADVRLVAYSDLI